MSWEQMPSAPPGPSSQQGGRERLNAADCTMLCIDRVLRSMGCPGFETQVLLWLSARVDVGRLETALARLGERYPVVAAHLVEAGDRGSPCWEFRPGDRCRWQETDLGAAEPEAVLQHAGQLLSTPNDLARAAPIRFHLLHRPDGRDVFLAQYNHALMDNTAALLLLKEIERLSMPEPGRMEVPAAVQPDLVWDYLRRFPRERRRKAASAAVRLWGRLVRGGVATLGSEADPDKGPVQLRIATRRLEQPAAQALQARVLETCGFPSLSMALLASVFRAIDRLAPQHWAGGRTFLAGIGIDLGLRRREGPIFHNLASLVPIRACPEDLTDRASLMRLLSRQMRERLAGDTDLGIFQWVALLSRGSWDDGRWIIEHILRHGFSLWYAYFPPLDALGEPFCGAPVEETFFIGPSWPAVGLTLLVNQFRGKLFFQATYVPESVPESVANTFLDQVIADLSP